MEPIGVFQGLASGINFRDLVDQIVAAERAPARLLEARVAEIARKQTAWQEFESKVSALRTAASTLASGTAFRSFTTSLSGSTSQISVSTSESASPGTFSARVHQLATREKMGGAVFASRTAALGLQGELVVGGRAIEISAGQSLDGLAAEFNRANRGSTASGVVASVVAAPAGGYRLILTAAESGSAGVRLADGAEGVLRDLGLLDGTSTLRHATSAGARSDGFRSSTIAVGTLLGLSSAPAGTISVGGLSIAVDLATDSLSDVVDAIDAAAALAGSNVDASVATDEATGDVRLEVSGTTAFTDANGVLELLGVLEGGRGAVAQTLQGAALTDGDASTAADAATLLTDLWVEGDDAAVADGDTLTLTGTRGDGSTFSQVFTVGAGSTLQDLVDALNASGDAFGSGSRTATASISPEGRLVVTDDTGGESRLALSVVAGNEGGGRLDFGTMQVTEAGRHREIVDGRDALVEVDGGVHTRSSNVVTDIVAGVTLRLIGTSESTATVDVARDADAVVGAVKGFVDAYNAVADFVSAQVASETSRPPLSGDSLLRSMRAQLRSVLASAPGSDVTVFDTLTELGIELDRNGKYTLDEGTLRAALASDPESVASFFGTFSAGQSGVLEYVASSDDTRDGTYAVTITALAEQARVAGLGFAGTYVDDGTPDEITITDAATGSAYTVQLSNGMTITEIVDALSEELESRTARRLEAPATLASDVLGTPAASATAFANLHDAGGSPLGIADGDTFTLSGTRADGTSAFREWTVTDAATQTLGDLEAQIGDLLGTDVSVSVEGGVLTVEAVDPGSSPLALTVSSDNLGGGSFSIGPLATAVEGRGVASVTAAEEGGQLVLTHADHGSGVGFDVAFTSGGSDGSASLGLAAGSYRGIDVAGTINGQAATGSGRQLTADTGTMAAGLVIRHVGSALGTVGSVTWSRGVAGLLERAAELLVQSGTGSIQVTRDALDTQVRGLEDRITRVDERLERRAAALNARFAKLEEALARAQQQSSWIQSQLGGLRPPSS